MKHSTTTTTGRGAGRKLALPPKPQKPYSRRELAIEVFRLTGETFDPNYLADVANGSRLNHRLSDAVPLAVANLLKAKSTLNMPVAPSKVNTAPMGTNTKLPNKPN